jgi:hypothetical protein
MFEFNYTIKTIEVQNVAMQKITLFVAHLNE